MKILAFLLVFVMGPSFAQKGHDQDIHQKMIEQLRARFNSEHKDYQNIQQDLKKIFKDDFFERIEKSFFGNGGGGQAFQNFDELFNQINSNQRWPELKTHWRENERNKILVLKGEMSEGAPLDIKVKDGMIQIKGSMNIKKERKLNGRKSVTHQSFQFDKSIVIPNQTNPELVQIENKEGEIHILFPKMLKKAKAKAKSMKLIPLSPRKDEKSI